MWAWIAFGLFEGNWPVWIDSPLKMFLKHYYFPYIYFYFFLEVLFVDLVLGFPCGALVWSRPSAPLGISTRCPTILLGHQWLYSFSLGMYYPIYQVVLKNPLAIHQTEEGIVSK